jgi:hypothetical protein
MEEGRTSWHNIFWIKRLCRHTRTVKVYPLCATLCVHKAVVLEGGGHRPGSDINLALVGLDDPLQAEAVADELDELPTPLPVRRQSLRQHRGMACCAKHIARVGVSLYRRDPPDRTGGRRARHCDGLGPEAMGIVLALWTAREQPCATRAGTGACPYGRCIRDRIRLVRPFVTALFYQPASGSIYPTPIKFFSRQTAILSPSSLVMTMVAVRGRERPPSGQ